MYGEEMCPLYSCTVTASFNLLMKYELEAPGIPSSNRRWFPAHIEIVGTMLNISTFSSQPFLRSAHNLTSTSHSKRLTQSLTLQGAEVGIASDYKKRKFVIRVRAEAEQFLLEVESLPVLLNFINDLETAIAVALGQIAGERAVDRDRLQGEPTALAEVVVGGVVCAAFRAGTRVRPGHGRMFPRLDSRAQDPFHAAHEL